MLNNMKVGTRLLAGFLVVALLGSLVASIAIYNMAQMNNSAKRAYEYDLMGMSASKEANVNLLYISRAIRNVLLVQAPERAAAIGKVREARKGLQRELERARPLFYTQAGKAAMSAVDRALADYDPFLEHAITMAADDSPAGHQAAIEYVIKTFAAKTAVMDDLLSDLSELKELRAAESAANAEQAYLTTRALSLALVLASLGIGIGLGIWITRGLTRQLGGEPDYAAQAAARIAAGELAVPIELHAGDARSLLFAMESMRMELARIVSQVRSGTDTIATASSQIASGNLDLSSRTEEQASSLEETASSMEELTSTVKQNADNARQANVLAVSASEVAQRGGTVVTQVVQTMSSINDSSRKIVDIIGVIDGIAFQTNILALNAAVEAARAGEQGRGFAVVASEVRNLAQRSAAAAKEIKSLIIDSVEKVEAGGKLVDQAGVTMTEIVDSITRVTDIMAEIAEASAEQFSGIEQINSAVAQMDEVTQQNAALVEEAAAAASSMQEQAATLSQIVSIFQLGEQQDQAAPLRRPVMAAKASLRLVSARSGQHLAPLAARAKVKAASEEWETF